MVLEEINEKGLRKVLIEMGATDSQMNARVVSMLEDAFANEQISDSETVKALVNDLTQKTSNAGYRVQRLLQKVDDFHREMSKYEHKLKIAEDGINEHVLHDNDVIDGLIAYKRMLEATRDTFGADNMTEAVMCKAIEAASYGMWRSVMGPK